LQVVELQELSLLFGMSSAEVVEEVGSLEAQGKLTGVLDDRGKVRLYASTLRL
jgi:hypothetical protein